MDAGKGGIDKPIAWFGSIMLRLSRMRRFQVCLVVVSILALFNVEHQILVNDYGSFHPEHVVLKTTPPTYAPRDPSTIAPSPAAEPSDTSTSRPSIRGGASGTITAAPATAVGVVPTTNASAPTSAPHAPAESRHPVAAPTVPPENSSTPSPTPRERPAEAGTKGVADIRAETNDTFVEEYCDLAGMTSWYPQGENRWQLRAPHAILAGVWNAGISEIQRQMLDRQPSLRAADWSQGVAGRDGYFLPRNFYKGRTAFKSKTHVFAARSRMYNQRSYDRKSLQQQEQSTGGQYDYYIDVSPGYLFYPHMIRPILCTVPWTKFIVVLRDPVERLYRQWLFGKENLSLRLSFDDWLAQESRTMESAGFLNETSIMDLEAERKAWAAYHDSAKHRTVTGAIGRSMYVLQLQEWFDAIKEAGMDPKDVVHVVPSEVLLQGDGSAGKSEGYAKLFEFLDLPPAVKAETPTYSDDLPPVSKTTEDRLEELRDFFAPYNSRLAGLLGNDFGGYDWKNVWKQRG